MLVTIEILKKERKIHEFMSCFKCTNAKSVKSF